MYGGAAPPPTLDVREATAALAAHVTERTPAAPGAAVAIGGPAHKQSSSAAATGTAGKATGEAAAAPVSGTAAGSISPSPPQHSDRN